MAFNPKALNNIAGSIGRNNLWMYITDDTVVTGASYFDEAVNYGLKSNDVMFITINSEVTPLTGTAKVTVNPTTKVVTIAALDIVT